MFGCVLQSVWKVTGSLVPPVYSETLKSNSEMPPDHMDRKGSSSQTSKPDITLLLANCLRLNLPRSRSGDKDSRSKKHFVEGNPRMPKQGSGEGRQPKKGRF